MRQVLVVTSSGRKNSNSSLLAQSVAAGAAQAGHGVTCIDLGRLRLEPCRGCNHCLRPQAVSCIINDDMQPVYPAVLAADILVLASPIYWFNLCGQLKQFIDRLYAIAAGPDKHNVLSGKTLAAALTYADADPLRSGCVNAVRSLQDICSFTGMRWAGAVYGTADEAGTISRNPALLEQAVSLGNSL